MSLAQMISRFGKLPGGSALPPLTPRQQRAVEKSRRLARLMDSQWGIGPVRFGAETLIDFIPIVGDAATAAVSLYQLGLAKSLKLPRGKRLQMVTNVALDFAVGLVPFLGDAADTVFKAHQRNQRIIDAHVAGRGAGPR